MYQSDLEQFNGSHQNLSIFNLQNTLNSSQIAYFFTWRKKPPELWIENVFKISSIYAIYTFIACGEQAHKNQASLILELND